ncbi:MAG: sulfite exporter TauE/SafE family protein [Armatimonadota bacterium]
MPRDEGKRSVVYLWLGLVAGLASTPHCIGMCGAFPLHLSTSGARGAEGGDTRRLDVPRALLPYLLGKTVSYAFLGALAGLLGQSVFRGGAGERWQSLFSYSLGAILLTAGLAMLGLLPRLRPPEALGRLWRAAEPAYRALLRAPGPGAALALGAATGFLPCPATFALCAAAAATHSISSGMTLLAGLGLGTAPALLAVGFSGTAARRRLTRLGLRGVASVVIVIGLVTLARPTGLLCRVLPGTAIAASAFASADAAAKR